MATTQDKVITQSVLNYYITQLNTAIKENYIKKVSEMPLPSENMAGGIIQYQGVTNAPYVHGFFYECVKQDDGSFKWVNVLTSSSDADSNDGIERTIYYGIVDANDSITPAVIGSLNVKITTVKKFQYENINCSNKSIVFLTPITMGAITSIKDNGVGFDYIDEFDKTVATFNGESYYCYLLNHNVTLDDFTLIFN